MLTAKIDTLRWLAVSLAIAAPAPPSSMEAALRAVDDATTAIFAFRDARGRPTAWPMTPYRDGDAVAVTSTLAFMKKTVSVRRDGRVALLANGWYVSGRARVHADISGDEFATRFLPQELRKYPPTRTLVDIPLHRWLFSWYFGRVIMEFTPDTARRVEGSDAATVISLDAEGFPVITPVAPPDPAATSCRLDPPAQLVDGPATVLLHLEPTDTDLRQLHLYGELRAGEFIVHRRAGSLDPPPPDSWWSTLGQQWEFHSRARTARRIIEKWK